jgi:hypothetical protein
MSYNLRIPKLFRPLAKEARAAGWTIQPLGSGHLCWRALRRGGDVVRVPKRLAREQSAPRAPARCWAMVPLILVTFTHSIVFLIPIMLRSHDDHSRHSPYPLV